MTHYNNGNIGHLNHDSSVQNTTHTVNHIYLHPESTSLEYNDWMRKIGSLLHIGLEYAIIKPVLELLVAAIEPERMFVLGNPAIEEHQIKAGIEIILIVDERKNSCSSVRAFVELACIKAVNVTVSVHRASKMEAGLKDGHTYYSTHCKEDYLVFSASRYRLNETPQHRIKEIYKQVEKTFYEGLLKAEDLRNLAVELENDNQHHHAAVMLHQAAEQVYRSILWTMGRESPATHRLKKLQQKAAVFVPQICQAGPGKADLESLDLAYTSLVGPCFGMTEGCVISNLNIKVKQLIQVAMAAFNNQQSRFCGHAHTAHPDRKITGNELPEFIHSKP